MKNGNENEEKVLCPICNNGMKCESVTFHSGKWNTDSGY